MIHSKTTLALLHKQSYKRWGTGQFEGVGGGDIEKEDNWKS